MMIEVKDGVALDALSDWSMVAVRPLVLGGQQRARRVLPFGDPPLDLRNYLGVLRWRVVKAHDVHPPGLLTYQVTIHTS